MKMNFWKRVLLFVFWLFSLIACAMLVFNFAWPEPLQKLLDWAQGLVGIKLLPVIAWAILGVYVLLAAASVVTICSGERKGMRGFIVVDSSETGKTRIAISAIDRMVRHATLGLSGVVDIKTKVVNLQDSISIKSNVLISEGVHVPTVTLNVQRAIRDYIEKNCGVAVREVIVNVHGVEDGMGKHGKNMPKPVSIPVNQPEPIEEPQVVETENPVVEEIQPEVPEFVQEAEKTAEEAPVEECVPEEIVEFPAEEPNETEDKRIEDE